MKLLITALSIAGLALASQEQPRFGSRVDLFVVSAIVRAEDNAMMRGLTRGDFELLEDGKPLSIATFAEVDTDSRTSLDDGRFIVLLLDDITANSVFTTRIKQAAHAFIDRMGPKDVMSVTYLDGSSSSTTTSKAELHKAIDRRQGFGRAVLNPFGGAQAWETIGGLSKQLARLAHRRKLLVCVGPAGTFNIDDLRGEVANAFRETSRSGITMYVIDPLGLNEHPVYSTRPIDEGQLKANGDPPGTIDKGAGFQLSDKGGFARDTGGVVFSNFNALEPVVERIWQEAGNYYLLGYDPGRRDNRRHSIEVRVKRPGATVQARRSRS